VAPRAFTSSHIKTERPEGKLARIKTREESRPRSFLESLVGNVGLIALQGAIVLLGSFLAAGLVKRALMGDFAIKFGPLELPPEAAEGTAHLAGAVQALQKTARSQQKSLEDVVEKLQDLTGKTIEEPGVEAPTPEQSDQLKQIIAETLAATQPQDAAYFESKIDEATGESSES
jgi:hypothetical protein